jgi:phage shock protein A
MPSNLDKLIQSFKALLRKPKPTEDPLKVAEQHIRDLKASLSESLKSLTEVKALYIKTKRENEAQLNSAKNYENKAIQLLEKARDGQVPQAQADQLATLALAKKQEILARVGAGEKGLKNYEAMVKQMEATVLKQKMQVESWENEMRTLQARAKVSEATKTMQERLARMDAGGTLTLLENLKEKVAEQEALAESYTYLASSQTSLDDEINRILNPSTPVADELSQLKAKVNATDQGAPVAQPPVNTGAGVLTDLERLKSRLRDKE